MAAIDSSSSCGPQANAQPPPPIAHAPTPIGVNSISLLPKPFLLHLFYNNRRWPIPQDRAPWSSVPDRMDWPRPSCWRAPACAVTVHEGAQTHRRRRALGRTDAARFRARCLLRGPSPWPSARRASSSFRWRSTASNGSIPTRRWPIRWTTVPRGAGALHRAHRRQSGPRWRGLAGALRTARRAWPRLRHDVLAPLGVPRHPVLMARFGLARPALRRAAWPKRAFAGTRARALFAGLAAHSTLPLEAPAQCRHRAGAGSLRARRRLALPARRRAAHLAMRWPATCARSAAKFEPRRP